MKLKNVYIGCTKDGKTRVFYQGYDVCNGTSYTVYTDLKTNERFTIADLIMSTLVPFGNRVSNRRHAFKKKVIKVYNSDMRIKYHVDNLYLADKCKVDWTSSPYIASYYEENNKPMSVSLCEGNSLFVKLNDTEYRELRTSKLYKAEGDSTLVVGDMCVNNIRKATDELYLSGVVNKNLALRMHYEKFGKGR